MNPVDAGRKAGCPCPDCNAKGWLPPLHRDAFPLKCVTCDGRGRFDIPALARKIDEDPRTLANVAAMRARPFTSLRTLKKLTHAFPGEFSPWNES